MSEWAGKTAVRLIWEACGSPPDEDCSDIHQGQCWVCGGETKRGMPREKWSGASFTGQNKVRCPGSNFVCEPCVHVTSRIAPVPGRPPAEGKKFGGNFRNYSHLWEDGRTPRYLNASKGEKPRVLSFLRAQHDGAWFAAIADSGQKHVVPWCPVNPPGTRRGLVLFDETIIQLPDAAGWELVSRAAELLTAGATKDEISSGEYTAWTWQRCPGAVRDFEDAFGRALRGGSWFGLALWLAQRDEAAVSERQAREKAEAQGKKDKAAKPRKEKRREADDRAAQAPGNAHRVAADEPAQRIPCDAEREHAEALGPVADAHGSRSEDERRGRRVADGGRPRSAAPRGAQLDLFGSAGASRGGR